MSPQIDNSFAMTNANTSTTNFNIYHSEEPASLDTSKVISFALSVIVGITSIDLPNDGIINLGNSLNNHLNMEFTNVLEKNNTKQFRNIDQSTEVFDYSNEMLEVEDLAEKVTQAQLNEIKEHFDTKLDSTKKELISEIKSSKEAVIKEIGEIDNERKENRIGSVKWFFSSVIIPIVAAIIGALFAT